MKAFREEGWLAPGSWLHASGSWDIWVLAPGPGRLDSQLQASWLLALGSSLAPGWLEGNFNKESCTTIVFAQ